MASPAAPPSQSLVPQLLPTSSSASTSTIDSDLHSPVSPNISVPPLIRSSSESSSLPDSEGSLALNRPAKRAADGSIKQPPHDPTVTRFSDHLRTRLKYAMIKVQYGWESRSFSELEDLPPPLSPNTQAFPSEAHSLSPRPLEPTYPTHRRVLGHMRRQSMEPTRAPTLAPAANIGASGRRRAMTGQGPTLRAPPLLVSPLRRNNQTAPGIVHCQTDMDTQDMDEKEMDAIDTLMFMSSPKNATPRGRRKVEFDLSR